MLAACGSVEQMKACGLRTVKQQLQLKRLLSTTEVPAHITTAKSASGHGKLSMSTLKQLTPEEKRLYLIK